MLHQFHCKWKHLCCVMLKMYMYVCVCRNRFGVKRDVVRAYSYVSGEMADIPVVEADT